MKPTSAAQIGVFSIFQPIVFAFISCTALFHSYNSHLQQQAAVQQETQIRAGYVFSQVFCRSQKTAEWKWLLDSPGGRKHNSEWMLIFLFLYEQMFAFAI